MNQHGDMGVRALQARIRLCPDTTTKIMTGGDDGSGNEGGYLTTPAGSCATNKHQHVQSVRGSEVEFHSEFDISATRAFRPVAQLSLPALAG